MGDEARQQAQPNDVGWGAATFRAVVMLVAASLLFVGVPNRLLATLALHLQPFWRDALMILYLAAAFAIGCWLFVRLQRGRT